jgi:hypothetical protein
VAHERVGLDPELEDVAAAAPLGLQDVALEALVIGLGRREGREVVRAGQRRGARVERLDVEPMRPPQRASGLERRRRAAGEQPVAVRAAASVVAGAEAIRRLLGGEDGDLVGQQRVDRAQARQRTLVGDDLAERVDAAVGAARDGERDRRAERDLQRALDLARDRPLPWLGGPSVERAAVILQG